MKIAIAGAAGRMGQMLIREIARTEGCSLAGALEGAGSSALGREAGEVAGVGPAIAASRASRSCPMARAAIGARRRGDRLHRAGRHRRACQGRRREGRRRW